MIETLTDIAGAFTVAGFAYLLIRGLFGWKGLFR